MKNVHKNIMKVKFNLHKTSENRLIVKMLTEDGRELFDYVKKGMLRIEKNEIEYTQKRLIKQLGVKKVLIDNNLLTKTELETNTFESLNKTLINQTNELNKEIESLIEENKHYKRLVEEKNKIVDDIINDTIEHLKSYKK